MRRGQRRAGRAGFTLVELLVVIAILALLAALIAAGIGKVREGAQTSVTTQTLVKLQKAIDNQWKVICDKCRDDRRTYPTANKQPDFVKMVTICDGDVDRAEALWMFLNLRREMPESFAEARTDVRLSGNGETVIIPKSSAFKEIQTSAATGQPEEESAALLYIILGKGARGANFSIDDAMQGAQTTLNIGGLSLPAFKDGFNNYVAFKRFYQSPELNSPEYSRGRNTAMLQKGVDPMDDPLDDRGKLKLWRVPNTMTPSPIKAAAEAVVFNPLNGQTFDGRNRIATAISAGPDSRDQADGQKHLAFRPPNDNDNTYGYRVLRDGNKE
ncbi:MAG: prepilin-type N-terminal cleavage/methylation domain-containing protein [Gemmataceae bacterium]